MKIAFTADNHLTTRARNPERYQALANILMQCGVNQVKLLVIAGDLFDQSLPNYVEFETLFKENAPPDLKTIIIPGNHDFQLNQDSFALDGVYIYDKPTLLPLNKNWKILLLPYIPGETMGNLIAPFFENLTGERWILIGHGDWSAGIKVPDPYEPGVYMPLTIADLTIYKPSLVFLGHIHLPYDGDPVYYPGSPCPINKKETGLRRYLILDTDQGIITPHLVESPLLYFEEKFVIAPMDDELGYLMNLMEKRINAWRLPEGWQSFVQVQIEVAGFSSNRDGVLKLVEDTFSPYNIDQSGDINLESLFHKQDPDRSDIAQNIREWIDKLDWDPEELDPDKQEILEEALKVIYGVQ